LARGRRRELHHCGDRSSPRGGKQTVTQLMMYRSSH
jgi:hypothetical protein